MELALRSLLLLGYQDDDRVRRGFRLVCEGLLEKKLACRWRSHRAKPMKEAMAYCAESLLRHELRTAAYRRGSRSPTLRFKFGLPPSRNSDVAEAICFLVRAGYAKDPRLGKVADWVLCRHLTSLAL